jgi:two-component system, NtrC family, response regulator HydG
MSDPLKILVVDDDRRMARTLSDILNISGYQAIEAYSAESAMELVLAQPFDCVITDIRMPGMDGVDLFHQIHDRLPELPVILMTAYASDERISEGVEKGAFGVVTKPLEISQILGFLSALSDERIIAVVDDDPFFCKTMQEILSGRGYSVRTMTQPCDVLDNLDENVQGVLLDMKINSIGGKEILQKIREKYPDLPVVLVTGYGREMADAITDALEMSAYLCMYKPLDISRLLETLDEIQDKRLKSHLGM